MVTLGARATGSCGGPNRYHTPSIMYYCAVPWSLPPSNVAARPRSDDDNVQADQGVRILFVGQDLQDFNRETIRPNRLRFFIALITYSTSCLVVTSPSGMHGRPILRLSSRDPPPLPSTPQYRPDVTT